MRSGRLRFPVTFRRLSQVDDGYGNVSDGTFVDLHQDFADVIPSTGKEVVDRGAVEAIHMARLICRSSTLTRAVTEADIVVYNDVEWNIRSVSNPDRRGKWLEFIIERGSER